MDAVILARLAELGLETAAADVPIGAFGGRSINDLLADGQRLVVLTHLETLADGGHA